MKSTRSIKKIKGGSNIDFSILGRDFVKLQTNIDNSIKKKIENTNFSYISSVNITNDTEIYKFINSYLEIYYMNFAILCVKYMQANLAEINGIPNSYFQQWKKEMFKDTIKIFIPRIKKFIDFIILYNLVLYCLNTTNKDKNKKFIKDNILDSVSLDNLSPTITTHLDLLKTIVNNINNNTDITLLDFYNKLQDIVDDNSILALASIQPFVPPPGIPPAAAGPGAVAASAALDAVPPDASAALDAVPLGAPAPAVPPGAVPPGAPDGTGIPPAAPAPAVPPGAVPPGAVPPGAPPGVPPDDALVGGATEEYNILNNLRISLLNVFFEANKEYLKNIIINFYDFYETNKTTKIFN